MLLEKSKKLWGQALFSCFAKWEQLVKFSIFGLGIASEITKRSRSVGQIQRTFSFFRPPSQAGNFATIRALVNRNVKTPQNERKRRPFISYRFSRLQSDECIQWSHINYRGKGEREFSSLSFTPTAIFRSSSRVDIGRVSFKMSPPDLGRNGDRLTTLEIVWEKVKSSVTRCAWNTYIGGTSTHCSLVMKANSSLSHTIALSFSFEV